MAKPNGNGALRTWTVRVTAALVAGIILTALTGCAVGLIRNGNRITALETHIPYVRKALERIEKKLERR